MTLDTITLTVCGTAILVVLQSYLKIERSSDGKWEFKFERSGHKNDWLLAITRRLRIADEAKTKPPEGTSQTGTGKSGGQQ